MEIKDAFWFKEFEEISFNQNSKRGKDAMGFGVGFFELGDGFEIVGGTGMEDDIDMFLESFEGAIG